MGLQLPSVGPAKIIAVVLVVLLGGAAMSAFSKVSQLERQLQVKVRESQALKSEVDEKQQRITSMQSENKALESRIGDLRGQLSAVSGELGQLRDSVGELQQRNERLDREKSELDVQVSRLTRERDDTRQELEKSTQAKKNLERAASRLRERFALLDKDYQRLTRRIEEIQQEHAAQASAVSVSTWDQSTGQASADSSAYDASNLSIPSGQDASGQSSSWSGPVELPPIIVGQDEGGVVMPLRGRVIDVSESSRFVVVNRGADDGVRVGMSFDLVRGGQTIGQGVVVRVRSTLAACVLVGSRSSGFPQVGDLAVQHGP